MGVGAYESTYRRSLEDREAFWREAAAGVDWHSEPQRILDDSRQIDNGKRKFKLAVFIFFGHERFQHPHYQR